MRPIKNAKKIDYNLIKVFDTVITEGNATRAARKLDVSLRRSLRLFFVYKIFMAKSYLSEPAKD